MAVALGATAGLVHNHAIRRLFDRPPTERHEACPVVQEALVSQAHGVRQVAGEADVDGRRADLRYVAAQAGPRPVVDPEAIVETDGEDLGLAEAVEAGADLLGVAAQENPHAAAVLIDGVVPADGIDGVVHRRADLLGVAAQADPGVGPVLDPDSVVDADGEHLGVAAGVGAGADLLGVAPQADPGPPIVDPDGVIEADGIDSVLDGRADLFGVAAPADPRAGPVLDPDGVVGTDSIDLWAAGGVEAGADLLGIAPQIGEAAAREADFNGVIRGDGVDRIMLQEKGA